MIARPLRFPRGAAWRRAFAGATLFLTSVPGCNGTAAEEVTPPIELAAASVEGVDPAALAALPAGASVDMIEQGRQLYAVCSVCHGFDARGTQLGSPLRGGEWTRIDGSIESIEQLIRTGVPRPGDYPVPMPVMGGGAFTDEELRSLALYVDALGRGPR